MRRWFIAGCAGVLFAVMASTGRGDDAGLTDPLSPVPPLIDRLKDPDPSVRAETVERLTNLGDIARPFLRAALKTANLQTKSQIDRVLLHINWTRAGDSVVVEHAFQNYADLDSESRCTQIESWLVPLRASAASPLLRILVSDPSPAVRWQAADVARVSIVDGDLNCRLIQDYVAKKTSPADAYLPSDRNAPLLALAGWATRVSDPNRATDLMNRALAIEAENPSAFRGQMDFVYQWLSDRAASRKDYSVMIHLLRDRAQRTGWNAGVVPEAIAKLIAAEGDHGPLPGWRDDLVTCNAYLTNAEMIYALARFLERHDLNGSAELINQIALLAGGFSADSHYQSGYFLARCGWNLAAERELLWSVDLGYGRDFTAYFELAALAEQRDDDLAAAKYLERGFKQVHDAGQNLQKAFADQFTAQMEWHYLRACRQVKDQVAMQTHLEKLLAMDGDSQLLQKDPGMAADIVPALQELGRTEQADRIFDAAYDALLAKVNELPLDPMPKNNLAWLCACSGKKLDDAVKYADQAVAIDPDDAACLDTQAEAYMRNGQPKKAAEIETRALQVKPQDAYMKRQLLRYRAAAKG